jgi:hypothetical protein
MPRFCCTCGTETSVSRIPNEHEASLVWDQDQDRWWDARDQLWTGLFEARANGQLAARLRELFPAHGEMIRESQAGDLSPASWITVLRLLELRADKATRLVFQCPACKRLHVQREHRGDTYDAFVYEPR